MKQLKGASRRILVFLCLTALFAGCGGEDESSEDQKSEKEKRQQQLRQFKQFRASYLEKRRQLYCKYMRDCSESMRPAELAGFAGRFDEKKECLAAVKRFINSELLVLEARGIEQGRTKFDEAKSQACLDRLDSKLSSEVCASGGLKNHSLLSEPECTDVLIGQRPKDKQCLQDTDCKTGYCNRGVSASACTGVCDAEPATVSKDEPCADGRCGAGLVCSTSTSGDERVCVERNKRVIRQACQDDAVCQSGLYCRAEQCTSFQVVGEGEKCNRHSRICTAGFVCPLEPGGGGDGEGLSGECGPPRTKEDSCVSNGECGLGLYCDKQTGQVEGNCKSIADVGGTCQRDRECGYRVDCVDGECLVRAFDDASCELSTDKN